MIVEFTYARKTYEFTTGGSPGEPPPVITIPFRPCVLRPPFDLKLAWRATDDVRGVELYRPMLGGA